MRFEHQPYNNVRIGAEIIDEGAGITGLTVTATLRRTSNGEYLQSGGGWGASPSNLTMGQVSSSNAPGLYEYQVTAADLSITDGHYLAKIVQTANADYTLMEYVRIIPTLSSGDLLRMLALRQDNTKFKPSAWDSTSGQPTAGVVYIYPTAAAAAADTTPNGTGSIGSYTISATFSSGQLTLYTSVRTT